MVRSLLLGLHGLDVKKHVDGWYVIILVFVHVFLLILFHLIGLQGLKTGSSTPFGVSTSLTRAFAFLLLLSDSLRGKGSLNETTMGLGVDVLMAGRTIDVPATMP